MFVKQRLKNIEKILKKGKVPKEGLTLFVYDFSTETVSCFLSMEEQNKFMEWLNVKSENELKGDFHSILTIVNKDVVQKYINWFREEV